MTIAPGTDSAVLLIYPGHSLHRELALMVGELGMTPMGVLVAATRQSAELAGRGRETGTLDADPLADIANVARVRAVVLAGRLLTHDAIDHMMAVARAAPEIVRNDWK